MAYYLSFSEEILIAVMVWIALSVPVALLIGRVLARNSADLPSPAPTVPADSPWRPEMSHRAALTALTKYPRLADDPRELTHPIYPFEAERARVLMRRRTKGIQ